MDGGHVRPARGVCSDPPAFDRGHRNPGNRLDSARPDRPTAAPIFHRLGAVDHAGTAGGTLLAVEPADADCRQQLATRGSAGDHRPLCGDCHPLRGRVLGSDSSPPVRRIRLRFRAHFAVGQRQRQPRSAQSPGRLSLARHRFCALSACRKTYRLDPVHRHRHGTGDLLDPDRIAQHAALRLRADRAVTVVCLAFQNA